VTDIRERLVASMQHMRRSPLRLLAVAVLAVIIFAALVVVMYNVEPDHSFEVTCMQAQGREGNLVVVPGDGILQPTVEVVVAVVDEEGAAVANATVKITGIEDGPSVTTDSQGMANLSFVALLEAEEDVRHVGVKVSKSNFKTFSNDRLVTIVRT